jgi:hypothetical protein
MEGVRVGTVRHVAGQCGPPLGWRISHSQHARPPSSGASTAAHCGGARAQS